jgi:hypothetical protein
VTSPTERAAGLPDRSGHAPLGGNPGGAASANAETSVVVQKAAYRRCWVTDGGRHCRWIADPYDDGYGYYDI